MDLSSSGGGVDPDGHAEVAVGEEHLLSLSVITYVGVGASLVCLFATIAAYLIFRDAMTFPKKILMNLCACLAAALILFIVSVSTEVCCSG